VHFTHRARSDDFDGALGPQWTWIRHDPSSESVTSTPGSLVIAPQAGDLAGATNTARNLLVQPALGDWTATSKLTFSTKPSAPGPQGGIIAYQDDDDYLKVDWEYRAGVAQLVETIEDSLSGAPVTQTLASVPTDPILGAGRTVWLRMRKRGPRYTTYYSSDGRRFRPIYTSGASLSGVRAGLFAYAGANPIPDLRMAFSGFRIDQATASARARAASSAGR
jgi:regulation of enolase protein 1 (concanavalin A-like superfamily)